MKSSVEQKARPQRPVRRLLARGMVKGCLFAVITAVVLNPDLKRAFQQIQHTLRPESLIQPDFPGMAAINREIDRLVLAEEGRRSEIEIVEKYVYRKIRYVTDYENWRNMEYWPTAEEVWNRRQEDCDGRAILAASILRSRGYPSARLVVGLKHMWVQVNEHDKKPWRPEEVVALLNPEREVSLPIEENPPPKHFLLLAKAFLQPTALRETSADLLADIPAIRKAILIIVLLLLCYHPCKDLRGLTAVLVVGLVAANIFARWNETRPGEAEFLAGVLLLGCAVLGALLMQRFGQIRFGVRPLISFSEQAAQERHLASATALREL